MAAESRIATKADGSAEATSGSAVQVADSDADVQEKRFRVAGGSAYHDFNRIIVNQAAQSGWYATSQGVEDREKVTMSTIAALMGLSPKDEVEGMLAAQMIATHNASMECFRRAMIPEQSVDARDMNLAQANKLTRSYATLVHAFDKHRGKGQQTVRVEHVNVYQGGQAIVGSVDAGDRCSTSAPPAGVHSADQPFDMDAVVARGDYVKNDA